MLVHNGTMPVRLPSLSDEPPGEAVDERLRRLLEVAHRTWTADDERRRIRAFGFRPAVEEGVLKREWRDMQVRLSEEGVRAIRRDGVEIAYRASDGRLTLDGEPLATTRDNRPAIEGLLDLIASYERWVEAREGREGRMSRARAATPDRRPVNALAETRRLQRILHTWGGPGSRRR